MMKMINNIIKGDVYMWASILFLAVISSALAYSYSNNIISILGLNALFEAIIYSVLGFAILIIAKSIRIENVFRYAHFIFALSFLLYFAIVYIYMFASNWNFILLSGISKSSDVLILSTIVYLARLLSVEQSLEKITIRTILILVLVTVSSFFLLIITNIFAGLLLLLVSILMILLSTKARKLKVIISLLIIALSISITVLFLIIQNNTDKHRHMSTERMSNYYQSKKHANNPIKLLNIQMSVMPNENGLAQIERQDIKAMLYKNYTIAVILARYGIFVSLLTLLAYITICWRTIIMISRNRGSFKSNILSGFIILILSKIVFHSLSTFGFTPFVLTMVPVISPDIITYIWGYAIFGIILGTSTDMMIHKGGRLSY
jgi:cell division protein FtsW (lipid II flippase)